MKSATTVLAALASLFLTIGSATGQQARYVTLTLPKYPTSTNTLLEIKEGETGEVVCHNSSPWFRKDGIPFYPSSITAPLIVAGPCTFA
jgi:hypothetical protein